MPKQQQKVWTARGKSDAERKKHAGGEREATRRDTDTTPRPNYRNRYDISKSVIRLSECPSRQAGNEIRWATN